MVHGKEDQAGQEAVFSRQVPEWCWWLAWLLSQSLHQTAVQMLVSAEAELGVENAGRGMTAFFE